MTPEDELSYLLRLALSSGPPSVPAVERAAPATRDAPHRATADVVTVGPRRGTQR